MKLTQLHDRSTSRRIFTRAEKMHIKLVVVFFPLLRFDKIVKWITEISNSCVIPRRKKFYRASILCSAKIIYLYNSFTTYIVPRVAIVFCNNNYLRRKISRCEFAKKVLMKHEKKKIEIYLCATKSNVLLSNQHR